MATFKQYLQNRWYRWMSQDRTVAYPYQFQYWRNINVRNEKGWVMLSSRPHTYSTDGTGTKYSWLIQIQPAWSEYWSQNPEYTYSYCLVYNNATNVCSLKTWLLTKLWETPSLSNSRLDCQDWLREWFITAPFWPWIREFRDWVFVINSSPAMVYFVWDNAATPQQWVDALWILWQLWTDRTYGTDGIIHAVYNFADTFFLVALWWVLLRFQQLTDDYTDLANWKIIRYFGANKNIVWLSQSWNYLKIYVTDWNMTECHYAQWTFDLEDSWLVQTIKYEWRLIEDCLVSDWTRDFWLFKDNLWIKLLEIDWYSYNVIRETERRRTSQVATELIFYDYPNNDWYYASKLAWYNWTLYCSLFNDWVWTFTKESVWSHWWAWWWVVEWWKESFSSWPWYVRPWQICIQWGILFVLLLNQYVSPWEVEYEKLAKIEVNDYPEMYTNEWYIIWNIYDWWVWSLFKKNVSTTLVCGNSDPQALPKWIISLRYRYDRETNNLLTPDTGSYGIKSIETKWIYDSVFITSIQKDLTWVSATDLWNQPEKFNRPWNTIEYIIKLHCPIDANWNIQYFVSPILYEHNLIYEDSMRKYR